MNKIGKSILAVALAVAANAPAHCDTVTLHTPSSFETLGLSPNGKWACGVFVDAAGNTYPFRWNLEGGSIEMLSADPGVAWDVANDGTVSGDFVDDQALANGAPVSMAGFWREGAWHHLEMPAGRIIDGMAGGISPDGQYMSGSVDLNGIFNPFIWKNGKIHRNLNTGKHAMAFAVAPDGQSAAGYSMQYNRTACYWPAQGDLVYFTDSPTHSMSPWNYSRNFSPDGSKLVYWGGWELEGESDLYLYASYDIASGERAKVKAPSIDSELEFFDISNSGLMVGDCDGRGCVYDQGVLYFIDDYLAKRGVDLSKFDDFYGDGEYYVDQLPISRVVAVSEDENVMILQYYNAESQMASMVLKMDQDFTNVAPAEVKASRLDGINAVQINWKRPAGANNIRGYNVYRNGKKINGALPINALAYYDKSLEPGTYAYAVSAVTTANAETQSQPIEIVVSEAEHASPMALSTRQKGVNAAFATWNDPMSDLAHKRYFNPESKSITPFTVYDNIAVEAAMRLPAAEMACYNGYSIREASFMPYGKHSGWAINIYTYDADGALQLLATQPVTQDIKVGQINTVAFDTPVALPSTDLIVAVEATVNAEEGQVIGADENGVKPGYSDLLRIKTDDDFFSAYESSVASGYSVSYVSWAIDLGLAAADAADASLTHYNLYLNGSLYGTTEGNSYEFSALDDGEYTLGVQAAYASGAASPIVEKQVSIAAAYVPVRDVKVNLAGENYTLAQASWSAPADNDLRSVAYTTAEKHSLGIQGVSSNSYALMAGAEYSVAMLRGYEGYRVKSFRFYPLADAIFTFFLYEGDKLVCDLEVEKFSLKQWNEVLLDENIYINPNCTYTLVIDCFDPEPAVPLLAIDDEMPRPYVSDLYSISNGESWNSLSIETGANGNWMIGMTIENPDAQPLAIDGYDVEIDGKVTNESMLSGTEYEYQFPKVDLIKHSLRVNAYYAARTESVAGDATYFILGTAGVSDAIAAEIKLRQADNYIRVDGDGVEAIAIYNAAGVKVASAKGNVVSINGFGKGTYLVQIVTDTRSITKKIAIK